MKNRTTNNSHGYYGLLVFIIVAGCISSLSQVRAQDQKAPPHSLSQEQIEKWMTDLSNWGRWGKEDQLGAMNLITPATRKKAAALVKEGFSVSLARDAETEKASDNPSPFQHVMNQTGLNSEEASSDTYSVTYHGMVHTHIDALCHLFYQGKMFNGFPKEEVVAAGAKKLSVHNLKNGIFARGVLVDIPRLKNVDYLEPSAAIYPADLDAWERKAGVKVGAGDVLLIRTGRWARRAAKGPWGGEKFAGLDASCAKWIRERDVAMLGSDAASDVMPSGIEGVAMPIHRLMLNTLGVWILDNCDLEAVSQAATQRNRWEFLLTLAPFPVRGGTGSPVNPVATF